MKRSVAGRRQRTSRAERRSVGVVGQIDDHHVRRADERAPSAVEGSHLEPVAQLGRSPADEALHPRLCIVDADEVALLSVAEDDADLHSCKAIGAMQTIEPRRSAVGLTPIEDLRYIQDLRYMLEGSSDQNAGRSRLLCAFDGGGIE